MNKTDNCFKVIRSLELFSGLNSDDLGAVKNLFEEKKYESGDVIFEENSVGTSLMVVVSGTVRISQKPDPNSEEALVLLKEGSFFGEMALLEDLPRTAFAIAHSPVVIFEISREKFFCFVEENKNAGIKILLGLAKILSARLRETDLKLKTFINLARWI